jgi:hypothetical protein
MGTAAAVAILVRREREIVAAFRAGHATSPDSATTLDAVRVPDGVALRRLRDRAVVRPAGPDRFYLDELVWAAAMRMRRRVVLVVLLVVAMCFVVTWLVASGYAR